MARTEDARSLLRQLFDTEVDLIPDLEDKTLTVKLHRLTQRACDEVTRHLCGELNATESIFPGTEIRLIYKLGSSYFHEIRSSETDDSLRAPPDQRYAGKKILAGRAAITAK